MTEPRVVAWFSCGAASAVAARLAVDKHGDRCVVVNCYTRPGVRLVRVKGQRVFLDELPPEEDDGVLEDVSCGPECAIDDVRS